MMHLIKSLTSALALALAVACTPTAPEGGGATKAKTGEAQAKAGDAQAKAEDTQGDALAEAPKAPESVAIQGDLKSTGGLPILRPDEDGLNRGEIAAEIEGNIVHGGSGTLALSSFVGKSPSQAKEGVIVAFGASWCGYCKASIPTLMRLQEENPTLQIVYVGTDTDSKGWAKEIAFFEREKVNFPLIQTENPVETMKVYFGRKRNVPRFYLLDQKGEIRVKDQGYTDKKMGQLLPKQVRWLLAQAS